MEKQIVSLYDITEIGLDALQKALGAVGTARFLKQFEKGSWDYTKERKDWLNELSFDEIINGMKKQS